MTTPIQNDIDNLTHLWTELQRIKPMVDSYLHIIHRDDFERVIKAVYDELQDKEAERKFEQW